MKNSNIKTVNGIGKACRVICLIAMIFCIVGSVFVLIGGGVLLAIPNDSIKVSGDASADITIEVNDDNFKLFSITSNNNGLSVMTENEDIKISKDKIDFDGIWSMDIEELEENGNSATYRLTGDFADFNKAAVKRELVLKVVEAFLQVTVTAVVLAFAMNLFKEFAKCETPFTEVIVKKMKVLGWVFVGYGVLVGMNLTVIAAALAVLMLAYVFAHGVELQKESDETV